MTEPLGRPEATALAIAAKELGLSAVRPSDEVEGGVVAKHAATTVLLQVKSLPTVRLEDLLGRLAVGVLSMGAARASAKKLVIVAVPHVSASAAESARRFMERHAKNVQWMLVGENGDLEVHAPDLGVVRTTSARRRSAHPVTPRRTGSRLFSDLNSWMLKVLLLADTKERYWSGPRHKIGSAAELAEVARVSEPHAYRFVRTFRDADFLRDSSEGIVIVRRRELVAAWFEAVRLSPPKPVYVRWTLGATPKVRDLLNGRASSGIFSRHIFSMNIFGERAAGDEDDDEVRIALAGFEACRALKVLHTAPGLPELHVTGNLRDAFTELNLEGCDERDAHFALLRTNGASVFRGAVELEEGLYCADILQAALDVVVHPARGREQAEHIIGDVLGWEIDR